MAQSKLVFEVFSSAFIKNSIRFCKINNFIGNEKAKRRLKRAVFKAYSNKYHNCSEYSFAFFGPPSTGKTHLAKLFAETLRIPFVVIEPQSTNKIHDIFVEIEKSILNFEGDNFKKGDYFLHDYGNNEYKLPPMIIFIDEVHNLKKHIVQGLLKATEPNDRIMITEKKYVVKTNDVCWIIATTDRGDLFDAFDTRFQKIHLKLYSKKEISQIVKLSNPDWSDEVCDLVAKYNSQVPREALAFARDMRVEYEMNPRDWLEVSKVVANDYDIDEYGMYAKRLDVLKCLGNSPTSSSQLPYIIGVKEEELKKYIIPPLMEKTPDREFPLVTVSSKGYTITPEGLRELDKRGLTNKGLLAIPESVRGTFV